MTRREEIEAEVGRLRRWAQVARDYVEKYKDSWPEMAEYQFWLAIGRDERADRLAASLSQPNEASDER